MTGARLPASLFFYGTLKDREILEAVLRRPVASKEVQAATLADFAPVYFGNSCCPGLATKEASSIAGVLFGHASARDLQLLRRYEGPAYALIPCTVTLADGSTQTARLFQYRCATGARGQPWRLRVWQGRQKQRLLNRLRNPSAA